MDQPSADFTWTDSDAGGWRIGFGESLLLVAEGSGFSRKFGEKIYANLCDDPDAVQEFWPSKVTNRKRPIRDAH